jgi:hypothetical protein
MFNYGLIVENFNRSNNVALAANVEAMRSAFLKLRTKLN